MVEKFLRLLEKHREKVSPLTQEEILNNKTIINNDKEIYLPRSQEVGVLLFHSFTSTPYEFCDLAQYLADKVLTVYAPKIAGHGTSPKDLAQVTLQDWEQSAENAYNFLTQKVNKIFIVGSSFGGNLAFYLASKYNNPLGGVISMGTPIKIKWQKIVKARAYTYGLFKQYYKKRKSNYVYKLLLVDQEQIVYPVIPISSLRRLFSFIKKHTIPNLKDIKSPTLIIQSSADKVVNPNSAQFIHENLGSEDKRILWINGCSHALAIDEKRWVIYKSIYRFISGNL